MVESSRRVVGAADAATRTVPSQRGTPTDPLVAAEAAAVAVSTDEQQLGPLGKPMDRRSPFLVGMSATAGVAVVSGVVVLIIGAGEVLELLSLALLLALGLQPAVSWLTRHGLPRSGAVTIVLITILVAVGTFAAALVPTLVNQTSGFLRSTPQYLRALQDHSTFIGRLNDHFQLQQRLSDLVNEQGANLVRGVLGAGVAALGGLARIVVVLVLTGYLLGELPRIRRFGYRLFPASRRPRVILLGDRILDKTAGYVCGIGLASLIAGIVTFIWLVIFRVPYPLLLAVAVAFLDLIPVVGSTGAGVLVSLVSLSVSWQVALATAGFYLVYRFLEDNLVIPKIMGKVVEVPGLVTVIAVLVGGALLGVVGVLVAIPFAATIMLVMREVIIPRLDRS
jgi:predicted PurR-regulated permease PerM